MLNKIFQFNKRGFTLLEVLASTFVLSLGAVGVFVVINQTTTFTQVTSSRLTATYLAQEGIEIAKNIRDTNLLEEHKTQTEIPWDRGLSAGAYYNFDYRSYAFPDNLNCNGKNYLNTAGVFFECSLSPNSQKLQRKIIITPDGTDILKISVEVSWEERTRSHQVIVQEYLYKWWQ